MNTQQSGSPGWAAALTVVFIAAVAGWCTLQVRPPASLPASAPESEFSAGRALAHLRAIATTPRPLGSAAHDAARDYILHQLTALGAQAELQTTTAVSPRWGSPYTASAVNNVLGRLPGTEGKYAVLLSGHYDSVSSGPGASDDAESVAMQLETLRALRTGPRLRNDVIFFFTDSEEGGMLGSKVFAEEHPWAKKVALAMNFDTRGTNGPAIMFETSEGNGRLVREVAAVAPYPVTSSLSYEVYKLLPNDSDLTFIKKLGCAALNFGYISNVVFYHTQYDDLAHLDPASLQHQGSYSLSLTRRFGGLDLTNLKSADATYFVLPAVGMVVYPASWSVPLAIIAALLYAVALALGVIRGRLSMGGVLLAFLEFVAIVAGACLAALAMGYLVRDDSGFWQAFAGDPYHAGIYRVAAVALTVAVTSLLYLAFRKRISPLTLWAGALLFWLILTLATSALLPGAGYLFVWPLAGGIAGLAFAVTRPKISDPPGWGLVLFTLPGLVLIAPMIQQVFVALTMRLAIAPVFLTVLLLGLLIPSLEVITAPARWWLPVTAALLCAACLIIVHVMPGYDHEHPRTNSVYYGLDTDSTKAIWFSLDQQVDDWTAHYLTTQPRRAALPDYIPFLSWQFLSHDAPATSQTPPLIERLEDSTDAAARTLRLRITSPRHATGLYLYGDENIPVIDSQVNGKVIDASLAFAGLKPGQKAYTFKMKRWGLRYLNIPSEGIELRMRLKAPAAGYRLVAIDQSFGLAGLPGTAPRPDTMIPFPIMTDSIFVRKTYVF